MSKIPILLLKTKSIPTDNYEEHFSTPKSPFVPSFVPVLEHQPNEENLRRIKSLLKERRLNEEYGGMIFTSQRAVEGFARVVGELEREDRDGEDERRSTVSPVHSFHLIVALLPSVPASGQLC
jgi:uroporphyrinogen-III synthase